MKIKAGIIGATGYAGNELLRLLLNHPRVEITGISSHSFTGQSYDEIYANYANIFNKDLVSAEEVLENSNVIFTCLTAGLSEDIAVKCLEKGKLMIDLGSDLRLSSEEENRRWYGLEFTDTKVHEQAIYSIPELHAQKLSGAKLIANPGCYPTSAALALAPVITNGFIDTGSIIIDSKSGTTGAGRTPTPGTHFAEVNEGFAPYRVAAHRHTPEIEQTLSELAREKITITFVPHLLPINRGILSTIYVNLNKDITPEQIRGAFEAFYTHAGFVRLLKDGATANLKSVKYSNFCDISLHFDERTGRLIIVSAIDNMVKGAAGQAIQNMNIALSIPEHTGLDYIPPSF